MKEYIGLLNPEMPKMTDKLMYFLSLIITILITGIYAPILLYNGQKIKEFACRIFTKIIIKDLIIKYRNAFFLARKGKMDILLLNNLSEPWMPDYFRPEYGDTILDIGAHIGKYTLPSAQIVGDKGRIISIEAHPHNYNTLLSNIKLNGLNNVIPINAAANSYDGMTYLYESLDDTLNSIYKKGNNKLLIPSRTIDSIVNEYDISKINKVKIDVEGAEVEVLNGMKNILTNNGGIELIVEIDKKNLEAVNKILNNFSKTYIGGINAPVFFYKRIAGGDVYI